MSAHRRGQQPEASDATGYLLDCSCPQAQPPSPAGRLAPPLPCRAARAPSGASPCHHRAHRRSARRRTPRRVPPLLGTSSVECVSARFQQRVSAQRRQLQGWGHAAAVNRNAKLGTAIMQMCARARTFRYACAVLLQITTESGAICSARLNRPTAAL